MPDRADDVPDGELVARWARLEASHRRVCGFSYWIILFYQCHLSAPFLDANHQLEIMGDALTS